ncbi:MAG TPA: tetratricopeptide repeat protein, partial [Blastocatellia bacterium]|nr:tetratricopeptide repeat protein [Blastocatellia bacterium]
YLSIAAQIRPNNPQVFYRLASAYAQGGNKKQALEALKRALANGFTDLTRLEQAPEFTSLRQEKEFIEILDHLKSR